ncbi:MAG: IS30 family transposase [Acidobacteria bacterium]|nr:IS30 family transposase [Acidobacteriota bacterium]
MDKTSREEISRGLARGESLRAIGRRLSRNASSISREIGRNARDPARYRATAAQRRAQRCAHRARRGRKLAWRWLARYVGVRLMLGWSPQQIAARLRRDYPQDMRRRISHETIYCSIYIIPRGELRRLLIGCLRQHRKRRRPRYRSGERRGQIPNRTPIGLRPPEVETRRVPGHWEGHLLKGRANRSAVGTLVERTTRLVLLARLPALDSLGVCRGFAGKLAWVPALLRQSLTYDQGREMARHELLRKRLRLQTYFADAHSPWQRASCENTNGLLRQYLPKNADLARLSQRELNVVAARLNNRPRKTLDWMTPNEAWAAQVKSFNVALGT